MFDIEKIEPWHPYTHPARLIDRIFFELSNTCNLSDRHLRCPLGKFPHEPVHLPLKHIDGTADYLGNLGWWNGTLLYNIYNEPTIDPRLMHMIEHAKSVLPKSFLMIRSNGTYLSQVLVDDLFASGLSKIDVTIYTPKDRERLMRIKGITLLETEGLDDRLDWYDPDQKKNQPECNDSRCFAPISELNITCHGTIRLCCFDWRNDHVFGDLNVQSIDEIIRSSKLWETYGELSMGRRTRNICNKCGSTRGSTPVRKRGLPIVSGDM